MQLSNLRVKLWFFCLISTFYALSARAQSESLMLIPDHFGIAEMLNKPRFNIVKKIDGYTVTMKYESTTEGLDAYLFQKYGDAALEKDIYRAEVLPLSIDHISEIFDAPNAIVRSWKATYQLGEIHLTYDFTNEYSKEQINSIFLFPFVFATANVEVQCTGQVISRICDSVLKRIPLFNQYRLDQDQSIRSAYDDYTLLNHYLNVASLQSVHNYLGSNEGLNNFFMGQLFTAGRCRTNLDSEQLRVCKIISDNSQSRTISEANRNLMSRIWPANTMNSGLEFFILGQRDFSLTNGTQIDPDHCSPLDAFCNL